MDVELCSKCEKPPSSCRCNSPGPIAIAMTTEPHHWAPVARAYLFTEAEIARDRFLNQRVRR